MVNSVVGAGVAFACVAFLLLGFYLVMPASVTRVNITDAAQNTTLTNSYSFMQSVEGISGLLLIVIAAVAIVLAATALVRGR
jgi:hypothetical protein